MREVVEHAVLPPENASTTKFTASLLTTVLLFLNLGGIHSTNNSLF